MVHGKGYKPSKTIQKLIERTTTDPSYTWVGPAVMSCMSEHGLKSLEIVKDYSKIARQISSSGIHYGSDDKTFTIQREYLTLETGRIKGGTLYLLDRGEIDDGKIELAFRKGDTVTHLKISGTKF